MRHSSGRSGVYETSQVNAGGGGGGGGGGCETPVASKSSEALSGAVRHSRVVSWG